MDLHANLANCCGNISSVLVSSPQKSSRLLENFCGSIPRALLPPAPSASPILYDFHI